MYENTASRTEVDWRKKQEQTVPCWRWVCWRNNSASSRFTSSSALKPRSITELERPVTCNLGIRHVVRGATSRGRQGTRQGFTSPLLVANHLFACSAESWPAVSGSVNEPSSWLALLLDTRASSTNVRKNVPRKRNLQRCSEKLLAPDSASKP